MLRNHDKCSFADELAGPRRKLGSYLFSKKIEADDSFLASFRENYLKTVDY